MAEIRNLRVIPPLMNVDNSGGHSRTNEIISESLADELVPSEEELDRIRMEQHRLWHSRTDWIVGRPFPQRYNPDRRYM